jgi:serine/threonine protein kinase
MKIIRKLGSGAFSDVYLVKMNCGTNVAVKKAKLDLESDIDLIKSTIKEIEILSKFRNSKHISNLMSYNKKNHTIVLELLGDNLADLIDYYNDANKLIPLPIVKKFIKQILAGLIEMKQTNVIHNDLKPENIMLSHPLPKIFKQSVKKIISKHLSLISPTLDNESQIDRQYLEHDLKAHIKKFNEVLKEIILTNMYVKISDFGNAYTYEHARANKSFRSAVPTRYYISPEILIRSPYWVESDMWGFGCIVYELLSGKILINPKRVNNMGINTMHIGLIIQLFGNFPQHLLDAGRKTDRYFIDKSLYRFNYLVKRKRIFNDIISDIGTDISSGSNICSGIARRANNDNNRNVNSDNDNSNNDNKNVNSNNDNRNNNSNNDNQNRNKTSSDAIVEFLLPMFEIDPKKRITPEECIKAKWLK